MAGGVLAPYGSNSSTHVSVKIGDPGFEYSNILEYSIDQNVTTLMDCFTIKLADPQGEAALEFQEGDPISVFLTDPGVSGGRKTQILKGRIIDMDQESSEQGGTTITVSGGDLGWHLVETPGPLFKSVMNLKFQAFLDLVIDPTWGFVLPSRTDNDVNRNLNQGRAAIAAARAPEDVFIPPVCFEAGEMIADKLITYARRAKQLVNVSADGHLQVFTPRYDTPVAYTLHYHKEAETSLRRFNNVKSPVRIHRSIEGLYSQVICVGTVAIPSVMPDRFNPHAGTFKGIVRTPDLVPFNRVFTFSDSDALAQHPVNQAEDRARQKSQRGQFDSWIATYTIAGHQLGGTFIAADTMVAVNDTVNKVQGNYYVSARRFQRSARGGTSTTITLRKKDLLRA